MLRQILRADLERYLALAGGRLPCSNSDLIRVLFSPRMLPVTLYRLSHHFHSIGRPVLSRLFSLANFLLFGLEIATSCEIGQGLFFPHTIGTVLGAERIGEHATIYHNVTIGAKFVDMGFSHGARPILGNNVIIGAGAKILGGITIGDHVKIGANAVVLDSVPSGVTVAGIPARIVKESSSRNPS